MAKKISAGDAAFGIMAAFIVGILAASLAWNIFFLVITVTVILAAIHYTKNIFHRYEIGAFVVALLLGAFYYHLYLRWDALSMRLPLNKEVSFSATVASEPIESEKYESFTADPWHSHALMVLAPAESGFRYGDLVEVRGIIRSPDMLGEDPFIVSSRVSLVAHDRGFWLSEWLINFKTRVIKSLGVFLPQDQAALLGGIMLGGAEGMSIELKNEMALSGTSYVLSMYGYKIAAVSTFAGILLKNFFSRRITLMICLALIALFVLMTGVITSAVRAGIMSAITLFAKEIGRAVDMRNAIVFTALIMLFFKPTLLAGDIGFQLSFFSILGIAYLANPIKRLWRYTDPGFLSWKEGTAVTLAVLFPMIPLIANADGFFPVTAIPSNILMFLATPVTVILGFVLAVAGAMSHTLAFFIGKIAGGILEYQLIVIKIFSVLVIPLPIPFNFPVIIFLYYAALAMFVFYYYDDEED